MTRRTRPSIPALLVAALALCVTVLGTSGVGNAAADLTKAQVKKIATKAATKVVKKSAPGLTVGNATRLNGKPASAYLDTATTFVLPTQALEDQRSYPFTGLAPGTYQVAYAVFMEIGASQDSNCSLYPSQEAAPAEGWSYPGKLAGFHSHAATALLTVTSGAVPRLLCEGSDPWQIYTLNGQVSRVTFIPVDRVTVGTPPTGVPLKGTVGKRPGRTG